MKYPNLYKWGFTEQYEQELQKHGNLHPARVTGQHHNIYTLICEDGFKYASVSGRFIYNASDNSNFPAVGDWVMYDENSSTAVIHNVLTRRSVFVRRAAGRANETQVVASNIDTVFICMALNSDYNLRRLERYLSIAWDSGAAPVVVFTKSDLCDNINEKLLEAEIILAGVDTVVCSGFIDNGYDALTPFINEGKTTAFIGSSGVGKSTLINCLIGAETLATREIRNDGKGRHTTTGRQLMLLPGGGLVMDTPGMRELGAVTADLHKSFSDIEALTEKCKFSDCSHISEPGCAVRAAIKDGFLDEARFENYNKLQTEADYSKLSSRQIEEEKIKRMFGGKKAMKKAMRDIKNK